LIYANNTWEEITFREALEALQQQLDLEIVHVLGEPPDGWDGETGYVTATFWSGTFPRSATAVHISSVGRTR
jgi:NAD(P)H-flavin reductase